VYNIEVKILLKPIVLYKIRYCNGYVRLTEQVWCFIIPLLICVLQASCIIKKWDGTRLWERYSKY